MSIYLRKCTIIRSAMKRILQHLKRRYKDPGLSWRMALASKVYRLTWNTSHFFYMYRVFIKSVCRSKSSDLFRWRKNSSSPA